MSGKPLTQDGEHHDCDRRTIAGRTLPDCAYSLGDDASVRRIPWFGSQAVGFLIHRAVNKKLIRNLPSINKLSRTMRAEADLFATLGWQLRFKRTNKQALLIVQRA